MTTINTAKAVERDHRIGSLEAGKQADSIIMHVSCFDEVIAMMMKSHHRGIEKRTKGCVICIRIIKLSIF